MRAFFLPAALLSLALLPQLAPCQQVITTVAGTDFLFTANGSPATQAPIGAVWAAIPDGKGNLFVVASNYGMVMRVSPSGILTVAAGNGIRAFSGDGGPATSASLFAPSGIAIDDAGNLFVADTGNHRVRKISPAGIISTVAGNGAKAFAGDGGPATAASLNQPDGVAVDSAGNLYIADTANHRIRKVTPDGIISTVAGNGVRGLFGDGGPATRASLDTPEDVSVDAAGNLYIADTDNQLIRKVGTNGILTTIVGNGRIGFSGDGGPAVDATLNFPEGVSVDAAGNLYIADNENQRIRKVAPNGIITTVAGSGPAGFSAGGFEGDGGPATRAMLNSPTRAVADAAGNLYIADLLNSRVRQVNPAGIISTFAGNGIGLFSGDGGPATSAALDTPFGVALDGKGALYVADALNQRIRRVTPGGVISTIAGSGTAGFAGDGGPATGARFSLPVSVALDRAGNVYVSDLNNGRIRRFTPGGIITTVAGNGGLDLGGDGGPATSTSLFSPQGIAFDAMGNLYIAETAAERVRKVTPNGTISTVAGQFGMSGFSGDGGPATRALLSGPNAVAVDAAGALYITDQKNNRIRRVSPGGVISTVAGNGQKGFYGDGQPATNASLSSPRGIAFDAAGNLYIADLGNLRVRKVTPDGTITTVAGGSEALPLGDGGPAAGAYLDNPQDVAADAIGNVYIADSGNNRVRAVLSALPSFQLSLNTLSFSAKATGQKPPARNVGLISTVPGLPFAITATTSDGGAWLSVAPDSGAMPAVAQITVDPAGLTRGTYQGTLTINAPNANPAVQTVSVTLTVEPAEPPNLSVDSNNLSFSTTQKSLPQVQTLTVSNKGGGTLNFSASAGTTSGGAWLTVSPAGGSATASAGTILTVTADPTGLDPGTYLGRISITSSTTGQTVTVAVTMTVTAVDQTILLSQKGLTFTAVAGGLLAAPQSFAVLNIGKGVMSWTASASTFSGGANWLSVDPASGSSTAASLQIPQVNVAVNPLGLAAGEYYGRVRISAPGAVNSPQDVSIVLEVLPAGSNPGPVAQPPQLLFTGVAGGASPGSQTVSVYNLTPTATTYRSASDPWLVRLPPDGTVAPDQPAQVVVQPDPSSLSPGVRAGNVTLQFSDGSVRNISVLFVLLRGSGTAIRSTFALSRTKTPSPAAIISANAGPSAAARGATSAPGSPTAPRIIAGFTPPTGRSATGPNAPAGPGATADDPGSAANTSDAAALGGSPSQDACTPNVLVPAFTALGAAFNVRAGWPIPVEVLVKDNCGDPVTDGSVLATFSNNDPALAMVSLRDGRWSGTWQPQNTTASEVTVTVTAEVPATKLTGNAHVTGELRSQTDPPVVGNNAIVNAASFASQFPLAPGSLISIFGTGLADATMSAAALPLDTQLAGALVTIAGQAMPLLFVSATQINAMIPYGISVNTRQQVAVRRGTSFAVPEPLTMAPAQPAIFTTAQSGMGQGVIVDINNQLVEPGNAAKAGDAIVIYCTGLGNVDPPVLAGAAAPSSPLSQTVNPVSVSIGDLTTQPFFAGLTPGFAGLFQVNVILPNGVPTGDAVPIALTVAGQTSPPVTLAVR